MLRVGRTGAKIILLSLLAVALGENRNAAAASGIAPAGGILEARLLSVAPNGEFALSVAAHLDGRATLHSWSGSLRPMLNRGLSLMVANDATAEVVVEPDKGNYGRDRRVTARSHVYPAPMRFRVAAPHRWQGCRELIVIYDSRSLLYRKLGYSPLRLVSNRVKVCFGESSLASGGASSTPPTAGRLEVAVVDVVPTGEVAFRVSVRLPKPATLYSWMGNLYPMVDLGLSLMVKDDPARDLEIEPMDGNLPMVPERDDKVVCSDYTYPKDLRLRIRPHSLWKGCKSVVLVYDTRYSSFPRFGFTPLRLVSQPIEICLASGAAAPHRR